MDNQRLKFVILIIAVAVITFGWITVGVGSEEVPYVSIMEIVANNYEFEQNRLRLGGLVEEGSITYSTDRLNVDFVIAQEEHRLAVHYQGLTPDMFNDGAEVIIEGRLQDEVFIADNLMTKCASRYEADIIKPESNPQGEI